MKNRDLISRVKAVADFRSLTQQNIADATGLHQGHLCKILQGKIKGESRAKRKLVKWLEQQEGSVNSSDMDILTALKKAAGNSQKKRKAIMQIMHILQNF